VPSTQRLEATQSQLSTAANVRQSRAGRTAGNSLPVHHCALRGILYTLVP